MQQQRVQKKAAFIKKKNSSKVGVVGAAPNAIATTIANGGVDVESNHVDIGAGLGSAEPRAEVLVEH